MADSDLTPDQQTRLAWAVVGLAMFSAVVLSSIMFFDYPLVLDEHGSYWLLESDVPSSLVQRSLDYAAIPPFSAWIQWLFTAVLGKNEFAFRLPSMLAFCAAIAVVIRCGWQHSDPLSGAFAGLLLAWNPITLNEIRIARCYGLVALLASVLLWITVAWWKRHNDWRLAAGFAGVTICLAWTHYLAVLFACLCGLALVVLPRRYLAADDEVRRPPPTLVVFVIMAAGLFCLPLLPALERLRNWSVFMELQSQTPPLLSVIGPVWSVAAPVAIAVALGLRLYWRRDDTPRTAPTTDTTNTGRKANRIAAEDAPNANSAIDVTAPALNHPVIWICALVAAGSVVIFLCFLLINLESVAANPRYQIAFTTALSLAMALGIRSLTQSTARPELAAGISVAAMIIAGWLAAWKSPLTPARLATEAAPEWRDAARIVDSDSETFDVVFVQSGLVESALVPQLYDNPLFMEYVACRMGKFYLPPSRERLALPFYWKGYFEMSNFLRRKLASLHASGGAVWVAAATDTDATMASLNGFRTLLEVDGWTLEKSWPRQQMTLEKYRFDRRAAVSRP